MLRHIITSVLLSSCVVGCGAAQQASNIEALETFLNPAPKTGEAVASPSANESGPVYSYEIVSPTMIRKDSITFQVSGRLTQSVFQFFVDARTPDLPSAYTKGNLVADVTFLYPTPSQTLELEFFSGGGGIAEVNGQYDLNQEFGYYVRTPIAIGQMLHFTTIVTFNEFTGIANPVAFELALTVE